MIRISVAAWFDAQDYQYFKALSPVEQVLPNTFEEWLELAEKQIAGLEANGFVVEKVTIDPVEYVAWCQTSSHEPNAASRAAFAVYKNTRSRSVRM